MWEEDCGGTSSCNVWIATKPEHGNAPCIIDFVTGCYNINSAKKYIKKLEQLVGAKMSLVSMGRSREETIVIDNKLLNFKS